MKRLAVALAFASPLAIAAPTTIDWSATIDSAFCTGTCPWIGESASGSISFDPDAIAPIANTSPVDLSFEFPAFGLDYSIRLPWGLDAMRFWSFDEFSVGTYLLGVPDLNSSGNWHITADHSTFFVGTDHIAALPQCYGGCGASGHITQWSAVPEPSTLALLAVAFACWFVTLLVWFVTLRRWRREGEVLGHQRSR